jgi:ammonia channel protein AmtB
MDTGTTAFMLCCIIGLTAMIPGLALFYGGMVSVKSSTNMMMTFGAVAVTAVHINSGAAALAVAIVLDKSAIFGQLRKPHNVPLTLLGAGLLWTGWYAPHRHAAGRLLRQRGHAPTASTACSTAAAPTSCSSRRWPRAR